MKNLLLFLFGLLLLAGCGKDKDDPKPKTASETVVGLYILNEFRQDMDVIPLPITLGGVTSSGTVNVTAVAGQDAQVKMVLTLKQTGDPDDVETLDEVDLQTATGGGYTLVYQGKTLGTADGTTLVLGDDANGFTAKK